MHSDHRRFPSPMRTSCYNIVHRPRSQGLNITLPTYTKILIFKKQPAVRCLPSLLPFFLMKYSLLWHFRCILQRTRNRQAKGIVRQQLQLQSLPISGTACLFYTAQWTIQCSKGHDDGKTIVQYISFYLHNGWSGQHSKKVWYGSSGIICCRHKASYLKSQRGWLTI